MTTKSFDLDGMITLQNELLSYIPHGHNIPSPAVPTVIACMGLIEELHEYLDTIGFESWSVDRTATLAGNHIHTKALIDRHIKEEFADTLFFMLEIMIFNDFSAYNVMQYVENITGKSTLEDLVDSYTVISPKTREESVARMSLIINALTNRIMVYMNSIGFKSWRPEPLPREVQLKHFAIVFILYAEFIAASGIDIETLRTHYIKKWAINKQRWQKAKKGDYSWDDRSSKSSL